jgi:hypothetical protein
MRPKGLIEVEGAGVPPALEHLAALVAALSALLDAEAREVVDSAPLAYRSRWRRAAVTAATAPFAPRSGW